MRKMMCIYTVLFILQSNWQPIGNAVDLPKAYKIANAEALKWDQSVEPYFITSVDDSIESENEKGADGKRRYWNFDFVIEGTNKHLIITLHDEAVVNIIEAESTVDPARIIDMDKFCISTAEAVTVAREAYGLLPGTAWAQGYHFVVENDGTTQVLSVVGRDKNGNMLRVFFNTETGQHIR